MGLTLFPSKIYSNSFPFISQAKSLLTSHANIKTNPNSLSQRAYVSNIVHSSQDYYYNNRNSSKQAGLSLVVFGAKDSGSNHEDHRALETVLRLYTAIENRNLSELSDIIGEECRCISNFVSAFQTIHGKQQVLDFFSSLMKNLGSNIEFVVRPTLHDGMNVGVSWKLELKDTHIPLGKGFGFYICHAYQGKLVIRNVEMFMEPLLQVETFRLKTMGIIMNVVDNMVSNSVLKVHGKKAAYVLLIIFFILAILLFVRLSLD